MSSLQHASNCQWATATVCAPAPYWLHADNSPWTCVRESSPRVLATTERCEHCRHWVAAADDGPSGHRARQRRS